MLQVLHCVDTIIFSLIILRGLTDSHGGIWRCHPSQLYAIEVTLPNVQVRVSVNPLLYITTTVVSLQAYFGSAPSWSYMYFVIFVSVCL